MTWLMAVRGIGCSSTGAAFASSFEFVVEVVVGGAEASKVSTGKTMGGSF